MMTMMTLSAFSKKVFSYKNYDLEFFQDDFKEQQEKLKKVENSAKFHTENCFLGTEELNRKLQDEKERKRREQQEIVERQKRESEERKEGIIEEADRKT